MPGSRENGGCNHSLMKARQPSTQTLEIRSPGRQPRPIVKGEGNRGCVLEEEGDRYQLWSQDQVQTQGLELVPSTLLDLVWAEIGGSYCHEETLGWTGHNGEPKKV